jgi:hypothetical protein
MTAIGIIIGFYGYLFPGNINIMVMDLYGSKKYKRLFLILGLIVLFESLYCIGTLFLLGHIENNIRVYNGIKIVSYLLAFIMGLLMVLEKKKNNVSPHKSTLYRGLFSVFIHPQQIPFWFIMGVLILPSMKLNMNIVALTSFVLLNAIGTLLAMFLYMGLGTRLLKYFNLNLFQINKLVGVAYIIIGSYSFSTILFTLFKK